MAVSRKCEIPVLLGKELKCRKFSKRRDLEAFPVRSLPALPSLMHSLNPCHSHSRKGPHPKADYYLVSRAALRPAAIPAGSASRSSAGRRAVTIAHACRAIASWSNPVIPLVGTGDLKAATICGTAS